MSEPAKRSFWQFHLSTALVLMFVTSVFVYANTRTTLKTDHWQIYGDTTLYVYYKRGWPFQINSATRGRKFHFFTGFEDSSVSSTWSVTKEPPLPPEGFDGEWYLRDILKNFAVLILTLVVVAVCCEFVIRRREARKA